MTSQGWDRADFRCGRCGARFRATTQEEYVTKFVAHKTAHQLLDAASPAARRALLTLALAEVADGLS